MMLKSVDLPQPLGPITATKRPCGTSSDRFSIAVTPPSAVAKRFVSFSTASMPPNVRRAPALGNALLRDLLRQSRLARELADAAVLVADLGAHRLRRRALLQDAERRQLRRDRRVAFRLLDRGHPRPGHLRCY